MTYEYVCTSCQHAWEEEQRISEAPRTTCPNCHQETAKRQVSGGAGFILKGSGWYADLYSSAKPGKKDDGGETKRSSSSSSSSESKADSAGESKKSSDAGSSAASSTSSSSSDSSSSTTTSSTKAAGATAT